MHAAVLKTFGGLTRAYYLRQLFFGTLIAAFICWVVSTGSKKPQLIQYLWILTSTLLYPYSRFTYESAVEFGTGGNVFFINAILLLFVKSFTMLACWTFALGFAPIGLLYLYFYHSKRASSAFDGIKVRRLSADDWVVYDETLANPDNELPGYLFGHRSSEAEAAKFAKQIVAAKSAAKDELFIERMKYQDLDAWFIFDRRRADQNTGERGPVVTCHLNEAEALDRRKWLIADRIAGKLLPIANEMNDYVKNFESYSAA